MPSSLLLPDVSEFQSGPSAPNWAGIKAQNGGAGIIRIGYGSSHLDTMFLSNYSALKAANFAFKGVYQYLRAGQDVVSQANAFTSWMGPPSAIAPGTVFILDLEEGAGDQSGRALQWHAIIDGFYGLTNLPLSQRSWLYSGANFAITAGLGPIFASARRTWVAAYQAAEPVLGHTLWQSTNGTTGSNITSWSGCGKVDTSIFHGSLATLAAMGWTTPDPAPTPPAQLPVAQPEGESMLRGDTKTTVISFANSQYNWISFFSDPAAEGKPDQAIRVAPWTSDTHDFAGITTIAVGPDNEKVTVQLPAHCAGISIQRTGPQAADPTQWAPVAWNLGT